MSREFLSKSGKVLLLIVFLSYAANATAMQDNFPQIEISQAVEYDWYFDAEELDFNSDLTNDSIRVQLGVEFNDSTDQYDFDIKHRFSKYNETDDSFSTVRRGTNPLTLENVTAEWIYNTTYKFYLFESGLYKLNFTVVDRLTSDTYIFVKNITIEGSVSDQNRIFIPEVEYLDSNGDECEDTISIKYYLKGYNVTYAQEYVMDIQIRNSTGSVYNWTHATTLYTGLHTTTGWSFRWTAPWAGNYNISISIHNGTDIVHSDLLSWSDGCGIPLPGPTYITTNQTIITQIHSEESGNSTETEGLTTLKLPFMELGAALGAMLLLWVVPRKRGVKK